MGNIYSPPKEIGSCPALDKFYSNRKFDFDGLVKAEKMWQEKLRKWCKKRSKDKYAGEIIKEPIADGYAVYMVFSINPVRIIHIPCGDAYEFQWAHRWTASDIKSMIKREKQI